MLVIKSIEIRNIGKITYKEYKPPGSINIVNEYPDEILASIGLILNNRAMLSYIKMDMFSSFAYIGYLMEDESITIEGSITIDEGKVNNKGFIYGNTSDSLSCSKEENESIYINKQRLRCSREKLYSYLHPDLFYTENKFKDITGSIGCCNEFRLHVKKYRRENMKNAISHESIKLNTGEKIGYGEKEKLISAIKVSDFWREVSHVHDFNHIDKPLVINTKGMNLPTEEIVKVLKEENLKRQIFIV